MKIKLKIALITSIFAGNCLATPVFLRCESSADGGRNNVALLSLDEQTNTVSYKQISGEPFVPGFAKNAVSAVFTGDEVTFHLVAPSNIVEKISVDRSSLGYTFQMMIGTKTTNYIGSCVPDKKSRAF
ncbi:hypothetical protein [Andreprevotia lacus]|jgi:hypothetical protein|uniref:hypothetical protein n=1 Tax=Andreprevotia lacus TaxID=1121000 RepID=UPI00111BD577|nr:hypothetical protein [Andreprevotia lacus]